MCVALIGENLDDGSEVCGAVVSLRNKGDRISVWTRSSEAEDIQMNIGSRLKATLAVDFKLEYNAHNEPKHSGARKM